MVLHIYAQLLPVLAVVFTVATFQYRSNVLPPLMGALFWFASAMASTNITFVVCCGQDPTYTATGTSDVVTFFSGLGLVMLVYSALLILQIFYKNLKESEKGTL